MERFTGLASPLAVLGLSRADEELYRVVLRNPGLHGAQLAHLVDRSPGAVAEPLARLVAMELVERDDEGAVHARPPGEAVGRLLADETRKVQGAQDRLRAVRDLLPSLDADHLAAQAPKGEQVALEVVQHGDVAGLMRSLAADSTGDLLWLRPDQWRLAAGPEIDALVRRLVGGGRKSRAIYPARVLEEAPEVVRSRAEAGESVRVLATVPSRLGIFGETAALLPERWGVTERERRLVVRQRALVLALRQLFEGMWERAIPVPGLDSQADQGLRAGDRRLLLAQLAGGAKDEQIARALGLSLRTVRRRVAGLLDELGVDSRFQAGVEAVRRGWV